MEKACSFTDTVPEFLAHPEASDRLVVRAPGYRLGGLRPEMDIFEVRRAKLMQAGPSRGNGVDRPDLRRSAARS